MIRAHARELHSPFYEVKKEDAQILSNTASGIDFSLKNQYYGKDHQEFHIPFIAKYQVMNAMLALKTMEVLQDQIPVAIEHVRKGMSTTRWQGRMETILPGVIVDGAHNEDGVAKFVETAAHFQQEYPLTLLFSAVNDKDYKDMIHTICSQIRFRHVVVTQVGGYREVPEEELKEIFTREGCASVEADPEVAKALELALKAKGEDGMLFCVGSLYLVGEIKAAIARRKA